MEPGVIITAAIFIAICSLPIILSIRRRKKFENQLLQSLRDEANEQQCSITQFEVCGDFAIGMDETKNFVFFKRKQEQKDHTSFLNLALFQGCELNNSNRTIQGNGDVYHVTDQLELSFIPRSGNGLNTKWVFYNAATNKPLNGELQSIEKWSKLIKERLKSVHQ